MKKSLIIISGIVVMTLLLTGCAVRTTLLPQGSNKYVVVATAASRARALQGAENRATKVCKQQLKQLVVLSFKSHYQGAFGKQTGAALALAGETAEAITHTLLPGPDQSNNYRVHMAFTCR